MSGRRSTISPCSDSSRCWKKNRGYDDDGARRSCVAIFSMIGGDHPTTRQYRRAFSNALYA